jgi:hypothetical protein
MGYLVYFFERQTKQSRIRRKFLVLERSQRSMRTFPGVSKGDEDIWSGANGKVWLTGLKSETSKEM